MRNPGIVALAVMTLAPIAGVQQATPANPITTLIKQQVALYGKYIAGGAEAMPEEKYGFKASPDVRSFGQLMLHVAQFNVQMCSLLAGQAGPDLKSMKDTDGKARLVEGVKQSFAFCTTAIDAQDDSTLSEPFKMRLHSAGELGPNDLTRSQGLIILAEDWFDHYSMEALYLRMNGLLPPSAERK
jgi:hypothetical protein